MRTERVLTIIFLVAVVFKLLHWPGANPMFILSLSTLSLLYFPGAFYFFCDKEIKRQNLALSIIGGICLGVVPIGLEFKLMLWPGGQNLLFLGSVTAVVLLIVIYLLKGRSTQELAVYYKNMLIRTSVLTVLSITFYLIPSTTIRSMMHRDEEYRRDHEEQQMHRDSLAQENTYPLQDSSR